MIHHSSITDEDRRFVETWENLSLSTIAIVKITARGDEEQQVINGPRRFFCTTEERLLTQDRIVDPANDPFQNGWFRPITVPATVTVETNPNALGDEEILGVLKSSELAWTEWLAVLDSPETLQRLLDKAEEAEASLKRYRQVEARLAELRPPTRLVQKDRDEFEKIGKAR